MKVARGHGKTLAAEIGIGIAALILWARGDYMAVARGAGYVAIVPMRAVAGIFSADYRARAAK